MVRVLLVGIMGGFIGSVLRYLLSGVAQSLFQTARFPADTMVNLGGCLAIGLLSQLAESQGAFMGLARSLAFLGILGGYTTFPTLSNESLNLLRAGDFGLGLLNCSEGCPLPGWEESRAN